MTQASDERHTIAIAERLRTRRAEIAQAILTRVYAMSEPPRNRGPEYVEGLETAIAVGLDYGLEGIEREGAGPIPIPEPLLAQARLAARVGVNLDTVLRRYVAGHTLLEDFLVEEAERNELFDPAALKRLLRSQAAIVDRLLAAVSAAYTEETGRRPQGPEQRKAERIEGLLAGEPLETGDLGYGFEGWHLGLLASGPGAKEAIASLARSLDARLLSVAREEGMRWAWLGSKQRLDPAEFEQLAARRGDADELVIASGEPGQDIAGWRLSHRQARAALSVALRRRDRVVRYSGVALLASALQDELLQATLRERYLAPLQAKRDGGATLLQTLRAYFCAERNVSSTAAALQVTRQTIKNRLQAVEQSLGVSLGAAGAEIELALELDAIDFAKTSGPPLAY